MNVRTLATALLLAFAAAPAVAQTLPEVGSRIRISAPVYDNGMEVAGSGDWQVGTLERLDRTSLTLRSTTGEVTIPFGMVRWLQVSGGKRSGAEAWQSGARRGALVGGGMAAGVFALAELLDIRLSNCNAGDDCEGLPDALDRSAGNLARGIGLSTVAGAGLGVLFGSRARERWTAVSVKRLRPVAVATPRGTAVALAVSF